MQQIMVVRLVATATAVIIVATAAKMVAVAITQIPMIRQRAIMVTEVSRVLPFAAIR